MARLIDADALREHLFVGFDFDKAIDDGIPKTEKEILAFWCGWNDALKSVVRFAPTVDPVKHGHWIMKPNGYGTCSNCKMCRLDIGGGVDSDYCPNCGAIMDEVKDETD